MSLFDYTPAGFLLNHSGLLDPRTEGEYAGVDRNNFNLPGADTRSSRLLGIGNDAQNRRGPVAGDSSFRADQTDLINRLRDQAMGKDSLAQAQLRQATDSNVAQAQGFAASARPGQAAMASRAASQQASQANQGFAGQASMAGIAERQAAAGALVVHVT